MQNLVSANKLAKILDLPARESVWRLVKLGRIPVVRVGPRMMRFDPEQVRAALISSEVVEVAECNRS